MLLARISLCPLESLIDIGCITPQLPLKTPKEHCAQYGVPPVHSGWGEDCLSCSVGEGSCRGRGCSATALMNRTGHLNCGCLLAGSGRSGSTGKAGRGRSSLLPQTGLVHDNSAASDYRARWTAQRGMGRWKIEGRSTAVILENRDRCSCYWAGTVSRSLLDDAVLLELPYR